MTTDSKCQTKYIYHLPFSPRMEICEILNCTDRWEELGEKYMKFDQLTMQGLKREKNPSDKLLTMWGMYNHTIIELLVLFKRMNLYRAMSILKPYVDEKYHKYIPSSNNAVINRTRNEKVKQSKDVDSLNKSLKNLNTSKSENQSSSSDNIPDAKVPSEATKLIGQSSTADAEISSSLPKVPYAELQSVTENWNTNSILGKGGFGTVYKAVWKNTMVAIKRIECRRCERDDIYRVQWQQLIREITILNSRIHENILLLYAYSIGGEMPCLVYQFMPNGSLEDNLLLRNTKIPLSWLQRHRIATGIACGLQYLHTIGEKPLIHADIKSANILLDKNMEPKIGDFGLAKEGLKEDMMKVSRIQGTRPYLPAEFLYEAQISTKVDTFSYGVVIYEMATGLRPYDPNRTKHKLLKDFVESITPFELPTIMDQKPDREYEVVFYNFIALGKRCCKQDPHERPEMDVVFQNLNSISV